MPPKPFRLMTDDDLLADIPKNTADRNLYDLQLGELKLQLAKSQLAASKAQIRSTEAQIQSARRQLLAVIAMFLTAFLTAVATLVAPWLGRIFGFGCS